VKDHVKTWEFWVVVGIVVVLVYYIVQEIENIPGQVGGALGTAAGNLVNAIVSVPAAILGAMGTAVGTLFAAGGSASGFVGSATQDSSQLIQGPSGDGSSGDGYN
jgi:hypothetical protein